MLNNFPAPFDDPISKARRPGYKVGEDPLEGTMTQAWIDYETARGQVLASAPLTVFSVNLTDQSADIAATDMTSGTLNAGKYRLSYHAVTATVGAAGDKLSLAFDWLYRTASRTGGPSATLALDSLTVPLCGEFLIVVDAQSPVRYTVTLALGGPGPTYDLYLKLEQFQA